jgi:hypothetical protein
VDGEEMGKCNNSGQEEDAPYDKKKKNVTPIRALQERDNGKNDKKKTKINQISWSFGHIYNVKISE